MRSFHFLLGPFLGALVCGCASQAQEFLPGTQPLNIEGDISAQMVAGIDRFLSRELERSVELRQPRWNRDFRSREAYERSVQPNRERLRRMIGAVDRREPVKGLDFLSNTSDPAQVARTDSLTVYAVRWPVFEDVYGEGLWLRPAGRPIARVIAIPDADQTPEMLCGLTAGLSAEQQFARRLAENGCEVLVPVLINRQDTWSGNARIGRFTNQPHREWIYRQAFELGRHIIGYEVQKVLAAVDFFQSQAPSSASETPTIGVAGYGEGGLLAFYAAALDTRIDAALVSGYFGPREHLWEEPICRNVFGLLNEFGDAEIAALIAPRGLIVEHSSVPQVQGPPRARAGRSGAAPGTLNTPSHASVAAELDRARGLLSAGAQTWGERLTLIADDAGLTKSEFERRGSRRQEAQTSTGSRADQSLLASAATISETGSKGAGSEAALLAFLKDLGVSRRQLNPPGQNPVDKRLHFDPELRQKRQLNELVEHTQDVFWQSEKAREEFFWSKIKSGSTQGLEQAGAPFRRLFYEEVIGRFQVAAVPANPRTRKFADRAEWQGYEVVLDVFPDVVAWGYLLLPKDLKPGERRPVVVCQHGLEGLPASVIDDDPASRDYGYYKAFAARLAERGFVVFAPHNPYRGTDKFRVLQRKANPLGKSLFSIIVAQHERILDWLSALPFVETNRIGFYGLSYGGKTAMRVTAILERYALSICSGDFNEWVRKNVSVDFPGSYMYTGEYEMPEWDLGHTFNYAEMAALIAPRPFMVERGHHDGVGLDEWVAYEYAKVRRFYGQLGIPGRTGIEFFDGPHTINGVGTFDFLHEHLNWPAPGPTQRERQAH